jgi:hypothetical protein
LVALLGFMDEHPALSKLMIVDALSAGSRVIERRGEIVDALIAVVDEGRGEAKAGTTPPSLTAEAVVGAVFAVIYARLLDPCLDGDRPSSLASLASELMGVIVHPYLGSSAAQKEIDTRAIVASPVKRGEPVAARDPFKDLPIRLTYRTARVLASIAVSPGASNKQIAIASGVADEGQMSRLLARLSRHGLVHNAGGQPARGEAKAWMLTGKGEDLLDVVGVGRA